MTLSVSDEGYYRKTSEWVSDCCLTPTQLFHGQNEVIVNDMRLMIDSYSASSLKQ